MLIVEVISVGLRVEDGVPQRTTVSYIVQQAPGKNVLMHPGCGVHGMAALGRVDDRLGK